MSTHFIPFPHGKLFKVALSQPSVAREFFQRHLPPDILERLDLSELTLENTSFIDDDYKATEADLIYKVKLKSIPSYVYSLFEQQTTVPADMAFRLEVYKLRLMEQHHKQYPQEPLPVVIALVLYTGQAPWTAAKDIFPLFGEQASLAREIWSQPYTLIDVCRIGDDDLLRDRLSGLVSYVFKYRKNQRDFKHFIDTVVSWAESLEKNYSQAAALINAVIRYIMDGVEEPNKADLEVLIQKARDSSSTLIRGNIMTFAQQLEQIGIEKGVQLGEAIVLKRQLERRFGCLESFYLEQLERANPEQLLAWSDRIMEAPSLQEIFGNN